MLTVLEKVDLLRRTPLFRALPTQSLVRIGAIARELTCAAGQTLYQENTAAQAIFFLVEGEAGLMRCGQSIRRCGENQLIGGLEALAEGCYAESAVATQPTRLLQIDSEDFFDSMAEDFAVTRGVLKALAGMAVTVA